MADMLQGAAGTMVSNPNNKQSNIDKWNTMRKQYDSSQSALNDYMSGGSSTNPVLDYTYNPYVPPEINDSGVSAGSNKPPADPYAHLIDAAGNPMPGHPRFKVKPDGPDSKEPKSFQDMMSDGSYMKATNLYEKLNFIPMFNLAHKMNMNQLAKEGLIDTGSVPNITSAAENAAAVASMDAYGGYKGGPSEGYGDGGPGPGSGTGAEGYGGASYGGHGEITGLNYGGPVSGTYSHGGTLHEEDWKKSKPLAKPRKDETTANAQQKQLDTRDERKSGTLTDMFKSVVTAAAVGKVANSGMVGVGYNKGGTTCPCGTPGCPGCGKGYNHGGPISAGGYKEKIAMAESAAKIERENMKAYADVYKKMKGPIS